MSERNPRLLIEDILEAGDKIKLYLAGFSFEQFKADSKTIDAVIRNFEIIGEASNRLPADFREKHNNIEWFKIIGFRNRIVHDYMGVDLNIVWNISGDYLPILMKDLGNLLNEIQ